MAKNYIIPKINQRLYHLLKDTGLSKKEFGALLGVSQSQISNIFLGKRGVTPMMVKLLEVKLNINVLWLEEGEPPMYRESRDNGNHQVPLIADIPAGPWESWIDSYEPGAGEDYIAVPDVTGNNLFAIRVKGDSMEPQLHGGDIVIIDPHRKFSTGVAVVRHHWGYKIRNVRKIGGKEYHLWPLNPAYEDETITRDEATRLYVPIKVCSLRDI